VQCGIEGALLNLYYIARDLLEALRNGIAVDGAQGGHFEDQ
jgi:hypothetical protein